MSDTSARMEILVHEIEELDLRTIFPREDHAFTPWLSQPENLARLARSIGLEIELDATEVNTGLFRTDIVGKNLTDGTTLVIENQFGRSDHDHFGKAMTYLAAHEAKTVVWIAESFADEHRAALTWLNDNTPEDVSFYGVAPRLMRIAGSPPGLRFDIIIAPNTFVKRKKEERKIDEAVPALREAFWSAFNEKLATNHSLSDCRLRYGGRLGFEWIVPPVSDEWLQDEPHVLVFITTSKGRQTTGVGLYCRNNARPEAEERLQRAIEHLQANGTALGTLPADLSNSNSMATAATELVERAKPAYDALRHTFSPDYDTLPMYGR